MSEELHEFKISLPPIVATFRWWNTPDAEKDEYLARQGGAELGRTLGRRYATDAETRENLPEALQEIADGLVAARVEMVAAGVDEQSAAGFVESFALGFGTFMPGTVLPFRPVAALTDQGSTTR